MPLSIEIIGISRERRPLRPLLARPALRDVFKLSIIPLASWGTGQVSYTFIATPLVNQPAAPLLSRAERCNFCGSERMDPGYVAAVFARLSFGRNFRLQTCDP
jgi:hypothetical protein